MSLPSEVVKRVSDTLYIGKGKDALAFVCGLVRQVIGQEPGATQSDIPKVPVEGQTHQPKTTKF